MKTNKFFPIIMSLLLSFVFQFIAAPVALAVTDPIKEISITLQIGNPNMIVNGIAQTIDSSSTTPIIVNQRTLLPIRAIAESLGAQVSWNGTTQQVTITTGNETIEMWIGNVLYKVNDSTKTMDVSPLIKNSRTLTPLRAVAEALGCTVSWDSDTKTVMIVKDNVISHGTTTLGSETIGTGSTGGGSVGGGSTGGGSTEGGSTGGGSTDNGATDNNSTDNDSTDNGSTDNDPIDDGSTNDGSNDTDNILGSVTIKFVDKFTNKEIATPETYNNLSLANHTYTAKTITHYSVSGDSTKTITLTKDASNIVTSFYYDQKEYVIELDRFGIKNDGTSPEATSAGLNQALQYAKGRGFSKIIFPTGTYLIHETNPVVIDLRDTVIDLNGSTLQINTNGLISNKIVYITDCRNVKLENGTILGDIDSHDYKTNPGTHEWNLGVDIGGGVVGLTLENLTVKDITGWGINTGIGKDYASIPPIGIVKNNLRQGSINPSDGTKIGDPTKISTISPVDITRCMKFEDKYFILAYDKGYMGNPFLTTNKFDVIFYDKNNKVISNKSNQSIYKKVFIPSEAVFADFIFYQPNIPSKGDTDFGGAVLFATHYIQPTNVKITNCTIDGCRSLGMAICGGDNMTIENCIIKNTKGQAPGYGVNLEDGWEFMNDIKFINNRFENNINDFVSCAGDNMVVEGNTFTKTFYIWSRTTNYTIRSNNFNGSNATFQTDLNKRDFSINGNTFVNSTVRDAILDNCTFENTNLYGSSNDINNCTFSSTKGVFINGNIRDSKFINYSGQGNFYLNNCEVINSDLTLNGTLVNGTIAKQNTVVNTNFNNSSLNLNSNVDLKVSNSSLIETSMTVGGGWNTNLFVKLENNTIQYPNLAKPFINVPNSFGRVDLLGNNLMTNSTQPVIKLTNPAGVNGQPLVAEINIIGNMASTANEAIGNIITTTFGLPTSVVTLRDINNSFSNLIIDDNVKNNSIIRYTTSW